jgi:hypothetical protein
MTRVLKYVLLVGSGDAKLVVLQLESRWDLQGRPTNNSVPSDQHKCPPQIAPPAASFKVLF